MLTTPRRWLARLARRVRRDPQSGIGVAGQFTIARYDAHRVRTRWPDWERYSDRERLARLDGVDPVDRETASNVVTNATLTTLVDFLDPGQTATDLDITHIVVGDDDTTPAAGDTALGNQLAKLATASVDDNGIQIHAEALAGQSQLNGATVRELGLWHDGSSTLLNHVLVGPKDKTSNFELTVESTVTFTPI